jgi:hypothetical protein
MDADAPAQHDSPSGTEACTGIVCDHTPAAAADATPTIGPTLDTGTLDADSDPRAVSPPAPGAARCAGRRFTLAASCVYRYSGPATAPDEHAVRYAT